MTESLRESKGHGSRALADSQERTAIVSQKPQGQQLLILWQEEDKWFYLVQNYRLQEIAILFQKTQKNLD